LLADKKVDHSVKATGFVPVFIKRTLISNCLFKESLVDEKSTLPIRKAVVLWKN